MRHFVRFVLALGLALGGLGVAIHPAQAQSVDNTVIVEEVPTQILGRADEDLADIPVAPLDIFGQCLLRLDGEPRCYRGVILGRLAKLREAPWQAQIYAGTQPSEYSAATLRQFSMWELNHICGGTLIAGNWVVTAAHCLQDRRFKPGRSRIRLGSNGIGGNDGQSFPIDRVVIHGAYNPETGLNDIGLVHIAWRSNFGTDQTANIAAIPLHGAHVYGPQLEPWHRLSVTGWGVTSTGPDARASANLKQLWLTRVPNHLCSQALRGGTTKIDNSVLCASASKGDTCQGDSGGPLTAETQNLSFPDRVQVLVGVVSWGRGCAVAGNPGVYTRITAHLGWIRRAIASPSEVTSMR
jgi:secreted trypsin-like serine protease